MRKFLALIAAITVSLSIAQGQNSSAVPSEAEGSSVLEQIIRQARDLFDLGRYGAADQKCRQVLAFDHENAEALHGRELIKQARAEMAARPPEENRPEWGIVYPLINWELPGDPGSSPAEKARSAQIAALKARLATTILPRIDFHAAPLRDAVAQLSEASRQSAPNGEEGPVTISLQFSDTTPVANVPTVESPIQTPDVTATRQLAPGVTLATDGDSVTMPADNRIPGLPPEAEAETFPAPPPTSAETPVTFSAVRGSLLDTLTSLGSTVRMKLKIDPDKVSLVPYNTVIDQAMRTISIRVPPSFIMSAEDLAARTHPSLSETDIREFWEASGVIFPPGAKAIYLWRTSQMIVRNTQPNVELVQAIASSDCSLTPEEAAAASAVNP